MRADDALEYNDEGHVLEPLLCIDGRIAGLQDAVLQRVLSRYRRNDDRSVRVKHFAGGTLECYPVPEDLQGWRIRHDRDLEVDRIEDEAAAHMTIDVHHDFGNLDGLGRERVVGRTPLDRRRCRVEVGYGKAEGRVGRLNGSHLRISNRLTVDDADIDRDHHVGMCAMVSSPLDKPTKEALHQHWTVAVTVCGASVGCRI